MMSVQCVYVSFSFDEKQFIYIFVVVFRWVSAFMLIVSGSKSTAE